MVEQSVNQIIEREWELVSIFKSLIKWTIYSTQEWKRGIFCKLSILYRVKIKFYNTCVIDTDEGSHMVFFPFGWKTNSSFSYILECCLWTHFVASRFRHNSYNQVLKLDEKYKLQRCFVDSVTRVHSSVVVT